MAFQASAFPSLAAATEMFPSLVNTLSAPRSAVGAKFRNSVTPSLQRLGKQHRASEPSTSQQPASPAVLPECLQAMRPSALSMLNFQIPSQMPMDICHSIASMSRGTLAAANPISRHAFKPFATRQMSTVSAFRHAQSRLPLVKALPAQRRTLFGSSMSRNLLAHTEEVANKNPGSATAQNAFYQALLRANMSAIVVERYQTGQFATNGACETAYNKALANMGYSDGQGYVTTGGGLSKFQTQAVGQAVAAKAHGGNLTIAQGRSPEGASGVKDSPLYVVVEETIGSTIFKWFKLFLWWGLGVWVVWALLTALIESVSGLKKLGVSKTDNEAKAEQQTVRFTDVHGCDEAKDELQEVVDFLRNPDKFSTLGGKLPKGVLLVGPPGTGKTLLARAVAGEAGVPFFFMSGSEFDEVYVGVGAKRVRDLFSAAKAKSPAIIFIDELDAIGGKRNARDAAYVKQTLNQLLTELDGFEQTTGIIILGATNFPEMLDKALTRPGRFDRNVVVALPDVRGRMAILKHHMKKILAGPNVDIETLAAATPGFSGAELENVINQAAVHASKAKAEFVSMLDMEWARDKVMMGAEKKSMYITPKEKLATAYHEAGHTLVGHFTKGCDPLHKVTILPRGAALGITFHLPEMDKYSESMAQSQARIDMCLGGKVAESLVYGDTGVTSGASSDLQKATQIAYNMVTRYGMSEKLGNVDLASNYEQLSSDTKQIIESEVRRMIEEAKERATKLLTERRKEMELLARALMDYETLDRSEVEKVIRGETLEGRIKMPQTSIKVPEAAPSSGTGEESAMPPLPGSKPPASARPTPPAGGIAA